MYQINQSTTIKPLSIVILFMSLCLSLNTSQGANEQEKKNDGGSKKQNISKPSKTPQVPSDDIVKKNDSLPTEAQEEIVTKGKSGSNKIALLFENGPHVINTPLILDILQKNGVHASFAPNGPNGVRHPDLLRKIAAGGNELVNRGWSNESVTILNAKELNDEIARGNDVIDCATGLLPTLYYPPKGNTSKALNRKISTIYSLRVVGGSLLPDDEHIRDPYAISEKVVGSVKGGDIVILHDEYGTTVEAVEEIIKGLKGKKLEIVSVTELLE
jgi:peptidoglycan/xylan/chitin deacetylase (PgdA/CDA1 family)